MNKNLDQFLTLSLDQVLTLNPQILDQFLTLKHAYVCMYIYMYIYIYLFLQDIDLNVLRSIDIYKYGQRSWLLWGLFGVNVLNMFANLGGGGNFVNNLVNCVDNFGGNCVNNFVDCFNNVGGNFVNNCWYC